MKLYIFELKQKKKIEFFTSKQAKQLGTRHTSFWNMSNVKSKIHTKNINNFIKFKHKSWSENRLFLLFPLILVFSFWVKHNKFDLDQWANIFIFIWFHIILLVSHHYFVIIIERVVCVRGKMCLALCIESDEDDKLWWEPNTFSNWNAKCSTKIPKIIIKEKTHTTQHNTIKQLKHIPRPQSMCPCSLLILVLLHNFSQSHSTLNTQFPISTFHMLYFYCSFAHFSICYWN